MGAVLWIFSEIFTLILGIILMILHVFVLSVLSPIFLYRLVLCKLIKVLNPSLGKIVTARGQFLASENFTDSNKPPRALVALAYILRGHQTIEEVRTLVNSRLINALDTKNGNELQYPELQQYVTTWPSWFGFKFWKQEKNFELESHVKLYQPYSHFNDVDLREWIETLVNEPLKPGKSPWTIFITNNFIDPNISSDEMTLITLKTHHCLADGYGWLYAFVESLSNGPIAVPRVNFTTKTTWEQLIFSLKFPFQSIYELSAFASISFRSHPWKIPDDRKAWKQLYCKSPIIPIRKIIAIKKRFEVSFGSVIHAVCASANRQSLLRRKTEKNNGNNKDELVDIGSMPSAIILPLPNHPKKLLNHFGAIYVDLPTEHSDPILRLQECEKRLQRARNSPREFFGNMIPVVSGSLTTGLARVIGRNRHLPLGISNFSVSASTQYRILERDLLHVTIGAGAQVGVAGANYLVYTYNKGIQFTVTVENSIMSLDDVKDLMASVVEEIDTLYNLSTN